MLIIQIEHYLLLHSNEFLIVCTIQIILDYVGHFIREIIKNFYK